MFQGDGDGGFARGGEAREPDCVALLAAEGGALGGGYVGCVEGDVAVVREVSGAWEGELWVGTHVAMMGWEDWMEETLKNTSSEEAKGNMVVLSSVLKDWR